MADKSGITIDVKDSLRSFDRIAEKAGDTKPLMASIAEAMHDSVRENFSKEGRPTPWVSLAPSTIKQREKKGYWPGKILQRTGDFLRRITPFSSETEGGVGTNHPGAALQNFGGKAGPGRKVTIPAREFMVLDEVAIDDIDEAVEKHLMD